MTKKCDDVGGEMLQEEAASRSPAMSSRIVNTAKQRRWPQPLGFPSVLL